MTSEPKVSIIVAVYKKEDYIASTLESIASQSYRNLEVIIINDGSPDRCPAICESFSRSNEKFIYISKSNSGVIDTRNIGLSIASGDLVIAFDADDIMPADFIEKIVSFSNTHPEAAVLAPGAVAIGDRSGPITFPSLELPAFLTRNAIPNSSAFRRSSLSTIPGYNPNMKHGLEDWDFWLYFVEHNMKIMRVPDAFYYYRVAAGSRNNMSPRQRAALKRQIYENHEDLYQRWKPHSAAIRLYPLSKILRIFGVRKDVIKLIKFFKSIGK